MDIDENETRKKCRYKNSSHYTKTRLILFAVDRWASRISIFPLCQHVHHALFKKQLFFCAYQPISIQSGGKENERTKDGDVA